MPGASSMAYAHRAVEQMLSASRAAAKRVREEKAAKQAKRDAEAKAEADRIDARRVKAADADRKRMAAAIAPRPLGVDQNENKNDNPPRTSPSGKRRRVESPATPPVDPISEHKYRRQCQLIAMDLDHSLTMDDSSQDAEDVGDELQAELTEITRNLCGSNRTHLRNGTSGTPPTIPSGNREPVLVRQRGHSRSPESRQAAAHSAVFLPNRTEFEATGALAGPQATNQQATSPGWPRAPRSYACAKPCTAQDKQKIANNPNQVVIDAFKTLHNAYGRMGTDQTLVYKMSGLQKVIRILERHIKVPTDELTDPELLSYHGLGKATLQKIRDIEIYGRLPRLDDIDTPVARAVDDFSKIWGVGTKTAWRLVDTYKFLSLDELREASERDPTLLNHNQKIGLEYYTDINTRIPRSEVTAIGASVIEAANQIIPGVTCEICGSYRRGKPSCGDIDILVSDPRGRDFNLAALVDTLVSSGVITAQFNDIGQFGRKSAVAPKAPPKKFMGLAKMKGGQVHRRLDILIVPHAELPFAMLYFTGSAYLNRSMRCRAKQINCSLSEHGLAKDCVINKYTRERMTDGVPVEGLATEADIFHYLGLSYLQPHERDHGNKGGS